MEFAIGLYDGFTALDAIGPYAVFTNVPDSDVVICAARRGVLADETGLLRFDIEHTFADVTHPDVVLVPGGVITRRLARDGAPIVEWLRTVHPTTTVTTSVCTGALLLGAAGLLSGRRATTHWLALEQLRAYGAIPCSERVVADGKVRTGAGVAAGIDLALQLVGELQGSETAQAIQLGIEYDPQPPYDTGAPGKAPTLIRELVAGVMAAAEAEALAS
ncbi:MAG TPA: DJ-1/PfpI family protein [Acidimicrobiia bacterium]|nr:DJ-1/PfpI family protein [Acidimicrobiia bacterium]